MYPSLGLGISTAFADAVELDAQLRRVKDDDIKLDDALAAYSRNRAPYARALQTVSRVAHAVLAATAEKPFEKRRSSAFDPSAAFFKMWRGALWVFGDR